jgi:hypothetical protein
MAKRMKPVVPLELNQSFEWIMPLRRPLRRICVACAASHADAGALAPRDSHCIELVLVESDAARYQRFSGVAMSTTVQHIRIAVLR